ncbi:hypothetical protein [Actinomadura rupiterrae]|uniref:hypothetical protein n=1 Tax=Actinomadura rupiterrae TaxID=559627 RepID=UPI0020A41656|nr:hypothetical protein [Actinomadura rupiterrae]MCP2335871.1 hypothetical protein [Actinomadura rupiterrae]
MATKTDLLPADEDGIRLPVRAPVARKRNINPRLWTTPDRVRLLAALAAVLAVLFAALVVGRASGGRAGLQEIGHDSGPQVVASSDLYVALNDMDAQLANVLLIGNAKGLGITRDQALGTFEQRRAQADKDLQQASALAGGDQAAATALRKALDGLGRYESLAAQAILLDGQHPHSAALPSPAALAVYRQATETMKSDVLPAAQKLRDANADRIESSYRHRESSLNAGSGYALVLGLGLTAALGSVHYYLTRRTRRLANPALLVAMAVALAGSVAASSALASAASHLHTAKKDAFDSVLALTHARAIGWETNADESRGIVDRGQWAAYQVDFYAGAGALVRVDGPDGREMDKTLDPKYYQSALDGIVKNYRAAGSAGGGGRIDLGGLLGDEFNNITFTGEREAAEKALYAWKAYQADDVHLRDLYLSGNLGETVRFDTSSAPGDSNGAFSAFDRSLADVIAINQSQFEANIASGDDGLSGWTAIPPVLALVIIGLVWVGVRPRLSEYR